MADRCSVCGEDFTHHHCPGCGAACCYTCTEGGDYCPDCAEFRQKMEKDRRMSRYGYLDMSEPEKTRPMADRCSICGQDYTHHHCPGCDTPICWTCAGRDGYCPDCAEKKNTEKEG